MFIASQIFMWDLDLAPNKKKSRTNSGTLAFRFQNNAFNFKYIPIKHSS